MHSMMGNQLLTDPPIEKDWVCIASIPIGERERERLQDLLCDRRP